MRLIFGLVVFSVLMVWAKSGFAQAKTPPEITPELVPYVAFTELSYALKGVNVFVGDGQPPLTDQSIWVRDGEILAFGALDNLNLPAEVPRFDYSGHTLIPGIVGMHNHLHMPGNPLLKDAAPKLYLASGVTTIATAGSADAFGELTLAKNIADSKAPGPRIFPSAPYLTGVGGNGPMSKPEDAAAAIDFVARWAERGVKWFKLYRHISPDIADIIIREAHKKGLKVTGHLCSLTYMEAAEMGIDSIEHGLNPATDFVRTKRAGQCVPSKPTKMRLKIDSEPMQQLILSLVNHEVTLTSTLAIIESVLPIGHRATIDLMTL